MTRRFLLGLTGLLISIHSLSQLIVENDASVEWYVEQVLLGGGVQVSNITFNGLPASESSVQLGYFDSYAANVGLSSGLILATGEVQGAIGPNNTSSSTFPNMGLNLPGDTDLDQLTNFGTHDAAILEFDFIPTGDTLSFDYVFASEEYPEFANGLYNDLFGFFLSGPGITGPYSSPSGYPGGSVNLATLPGSGVEVSINSVNNGQDNSGPCEHCEYYLHNGDGFESPYNSQPSYIQYDGLTTMLTASAEVECGSTYHIKIVIADVVDNGYDSAVFLREAGFLTTSSVALDLSFDFPTPYGSDVVIEGCYTGTIGLERFDNLEDEHTISLTYGGTAINGVDYETLPDEITFLAGEATVELDLIAISDDLSEGSESLSIEIAQSICDVMVQNVFSFAILDDAGPLDLQQSSYAIDCNESVTIGGLASGGVGLYAYSWDTGEVSPFIEVNPLVTSGYTLMVTDTCVAEPVEITYLVEVADYPEVQVLLPEDIQLDCLDSTFEIEPIISSGGNGLLDYEWTINGILVSSDPSLIWTADEDLDVVLTVTDACGDSATDDIAVSMESYSPIEILLPEFVELDCSNPVITLDPVLSGGQGLLNLSWAQDGVDMGTQEQIELGTDSSSIVLLTVTDECLSSSQVSVLLNYTEAPAMQLEMGDDIFLECSESTVNLNFQSLSGGQGPFTYSWSSDGEFLGEGASLETAVTGGGTVTLTVSDACGQTLSDDVTIISQPYTAPSAFLIGDSEGCPGDMVSLYAMPDDGKSPYTYFWPHNSATTEVTVAYPTSTTSYAVSITDACGNTATASTEIYIHPVEASFELHETGYYSYEGLNTSASNSEEILSYSWYVDGFLVSDQIDYSHSFSDLADHSLSLAVENPAGCTDSIWVNLSPPSSLYIPSAFSPDGDGLNDLFKVYHHDLMSFSMKIFDRWGSQVFETYDPDQSWNGSVNQKEHFSSTSSIYVYHIIAQGLDGTHYDLRGEVIILR